MYQGKLMVNDSFLETQDSTSSILELFDERYNFYEIISWSYSEIQSIASLGTCEIKISSIHVRIQSLFCRPANKENCTVSSIYPWDRIGRSQDSQKKTKTRWRCNSSGQRNYSITSWFSIHSSDSLPQKDFESCQKRKSLHSSRQLAPANTSICQNFQRRIKHSSNTSWLKNCLKNSECLNTLKCKISVFCFMQVIFKFYFPKVDQQNNT